MKIQSSASVKRSQAGNALVTTMVILSAALLTLAGILSWSSGSARVSTRFNQYNRTLAAAEAGTEKAVGLIMQDFLNGSESLVTFNLNSYSANVPNSSDSSYWSGYQFSDAQGNPGKTYIQKMSASNYTILTPPFTGLYSYTSTYNVVSDAAELNNLQSVTAGNFQQIQLTTIPVFQFAMYSSSDMEIEPGEPLTVLGPVHANGWLYLNPAAELEFAYNVSAVKQVALSRSPQDYLRAAATTGYVLFDHGLSTNVTPLTLPIGTTNTPTAVRALIQPPPAGESVNSAIGLLRYYNKVDMILTVSSAGIVTATSGIFNNSATTVSSNDLVKFILTTNQFYDGRENKYVQPVDIDVSQFTLWSATNTSVRAALGNRNVSSIYINDNRTGTASILPAVRLWDGTNLPSLGLTVATLDPLYVWGNYNQTNPANLYTTNTTTTRPASIAADAVTILSPAWQDANSYTSSCSSRPASITTVNAAILSGEMPTLNGNYSGGMENFMRFLENWSGVTYSYNGSLVIMFPSQFATSIWPNTGTVYNPPNRAYSFDLNFNDATKLPPLTPGLETIARSQWASLAANQLTPTNINY